MRILPNAGRIMLPKALGGGTEFGCRDRPLRPPVKLAAVDPPAPDRGLEVLPLAGPVEIETDRHRPVANRLALPLAAARQG